MQGRQSPNALPYIATWLQCHLWSVSAARSLLNSPAQLEACCVLKAVEHGVHHRSFMLSLDGATLHVVLVGDLHAIL